LAGCNYFMGVPCADDVMLNYQSTSYHDAAGVRQVLGLRPTPEFLAWLEERGIFQEGRLARGEGLGRQRLLERVGGLLALEEAK
jgi:ethanolamine ammonia-lyase large subunit